MWYSKMYFSEKREFFQFDASGTQGAPSTCREFPFLESLLTFLEMDCQQLTPPTHPSPEANQPQLEPPDRRG